MVSIVSRFLVGCTQFKTGLTCVNNTQKLFMGFWVEKNRTSQRMSLKINLLLGYHDFQGRVENKPCLDSYQIKDLEPEHNF